MKTFKPYVAWLLTIAVLTGIGRHALASSIIPLSATEHLDASAAVFRGTVLSQSSFRDQDGLIYTRANVRVDEPLMGQFPEIVAVVHRGGRVGAEDEYEGLSPRFATGGEYLLFVRRRADGRLHCTQGFASAVPLAAAASNQASATGLQLLAEVRASLKQHPRHGTDVTDQAGSAITDATTGMLGGVNTRFLQPDRGEPIPYLIDADSLPAGMSLAQATNAVQQAINAWTAVTSLKFRLEGITSFGQAANTVAISDEKLRIQLHDNYGAINSPGTLGIGGRGSLTSPVSGVGWDLGGNVAGNEFMKTSRGYVVLESGSTTLQNTNAFAEVLCHEIGHALNMAHSSENSGEANSTLREAIMFFQAHNDGRGATLGAYDPPIIQQCYPSNTAPFCFNRVMHITTDTPAQPNVPGINDVELRGYDLQSSSLTVATNGATGVGTGTFSRTGNILKFTPNNFWQTDPIDPSDNSFFELIYARYSDGVNASPYCTIRVLSHSPDSFPATSDGIPDNWMTTHFGSANPAAGANRGAQQDHDGDGMKNIDEYRAGMNPSALSGGASSGQLITVINQTNIQFQAKPYEVYELHASTNLTNWVRAATPIVPTTSTGTFTGFTNNAPYLFFRVQKVP